MRFAHLMSGLALVVCAGAVHAQATPPSTPQTTAVIDPPIVAAPPLTAPPPVSSLTMPKWSEFPVPPTGVPTPKDIAVQVKMQTDTAAALTAEVANLHWDGDAAEPFKAQTVARLDPDMLKPVDEQMSAEAIEAFGADLRRKAVPPPVAN